MAFADLFDDEAPVTGKYGADEDYLPNRVEDEVNMRMIIDQRARPRLVARWPVTYWNDDLFGQGTVLTVSTLGCRVAGTMTVFEGMRIKLWISPPHHEDELGVEDATVIWAKGHEFGVRFDGVAASQRRKLAIFLQSAERRRQSFQMEALPFESD